MLKKYPHNPAHLCLDDTPYFITAAIYQKRPLLVEPAIKCALVDLLQTYFRKYHWELHHWVILDNHYHVLGKSYKGLNMQHIFRTIHSQIAIVIHQTTACQKPVWWNYWDYCPRSEADYMIRLNYLLNNPVKHGYVNRLQDYSFSSFPLLFDRVGRAQLVKRFQAYPEYKSLTLSEAEMDDF